MAKAKEYVIKGFILLMVSICSVSIYSMASKQKATIKAIRPMIEKETEKTQTVEPDVVILGTLMSQASSILYMLLLRHPNIFTTLHKPVELQFSKKGKPSKNQLIAELSTSYLTRPGTCEQLKNLGYPNHVRFVLVVRDPVERALAHYNSNKNIRKGLLNDNGELNRNSGVLMAGYYYIHLIKWLKCYSRRRYLIIDGHELDTDPARSLQKVLQFLELPESPKGLEITKDDKKGTFCVTGNSNKRKCKGKVAAASDVPDGLKQKLYDYYEKKNEQFYKLVNKKFDWNNKKPNIKPTSIVNRTSVPNLPAKVLPKVIIIGAWKAGTGALNLFLIKHPQIAGTNREINYFTVNSDESKEWYFSQLKTAQDSQLVLEYSASYFYYPERVCNRIKEMGYSSKTKFLFVVREPVSRVISHLTMNHRRKKLNKSRAGLRDDKLVDRHNNINENNPVIKAGYYYLHLSKWYKCFPKEQILVTDGDRLRKDPAAEIKNVQKFLGISDGTDAMGFKKGKDGEFCVRRNPNRRSLECRKGTAHNEYSYVPDTVKKIMVEYYKPKNELFFKLVGKRFDWNQEVND